MRRWEVYKEDWAYWLVTDGVAVVEKGVKEEQKSDAINVEMEELRRQNSLLKARLQDAIDEISRLKKESDLDLYNHVKFLYERYVNWRDFVHNKLRYYAKQRQVNEDEIRDEIYWWYRYSEWEDELAELDFIGELVEGREAKKQKEIDELPF